MKEKAASDLLMQSDTIKSKKISAKTKKRKPTSAIIPDQPLSVIEESIEEDIYQNIVNESIVNKPNEEEFHARMHKVYDKLYNPR